MKTEFPVRPGWLAVIAIVVLAGCTTSPKVTVRQAGDAGLSCAALSERLSELAQTEKVVRNNKGHAGRNAVGAVLWLPGYVYSQNDADRALRLIAERRAWLNELRQRRNCG